MKPTAIKTTFAADTSFLLSLLGTDSNTESALEIIRLLHSPLNLSPLNDLELLNASFMAEFQGFREKGSSARIEEMFESEKQSGRLIHPPFNPTRAIMLATELTRRHTLSQGQRTYNVLLVAAALEMEATHFLTFDARQAKLAAAEGLTIQGVEIQ